MFHVKVQRFIEAIDGLKVTSAQFLSAQKDNNKEVMAATSRSGVIFLDAICTSLLGYNDDHQHGVKSESKGLKSLGFGELYSHGISLEQRKRLAIDPDGVCRELGKATVPNFKDILNKTKHRNELYSTFQVVNGQHFLLLSGQGFGDKKNESYLLKFNVDSFCKFSKEMISEMDSFYQMAGAE